MRFDIRLINEIPSGRGDSLLTVNKKSQEKKELTLSDGVIISHPNAFRSNNKGQENRLNCFQKTVFHGE